MPPPLTCLKEANDVQEKYFTKAVEVLKFYYDDYVWKDWNIIMAYFSYDMKNYSPRQDLDPSIWASWLDRCCAFVHGLNVGKGTDVSFEELKSILEHECDSESLADLSLYGYNLVSDEILCPTCNECACGQCSPCSCSPMS